METCTNCKKEVGRHYAKKMCYNCYLKDYQRRLREQSTVKEDGSP